MRSPVDDRLHLLGLSEYLELPPPLIERLLHRSYLPGEQAGGFWNFDRDEVDRWLDLGMPGWHQEELHAVAAARRPVPASLASALKTGKVILDLHVKDGEAALEQLVATIEPPASVDRQILLNRLLARERLSSTALDNGFAIPHTSRNEVRLVAQNVVAFARMSPAIPFGAPDGCLTDLVFLILAADQSAHLALLARVASLTKYPLIAFALRAAVSPDEVFGIVSRAEQLFFESPSKGTR